MTGPRHVTAARAGRALAVQASASAPPAAPAAASSSASAADACALGASPGASASAAGSGAAAPCAAACAVPRHVCTWSRSAAGVLSARPQRHVCTLAWRLTCSFSRYCSTKSLPHCVQTRRASLCALLWCRRAVSTFFSTLPPAAYLQPSTGQWNGPAGGAPSGGGSRTAAASCGVCDFRWKRSALTVLQLRAQPATGQFSLPFARRHSSGSTVPAGAGAPAPGATRADAAGPDMPPRDAARARTAAARDGAQRGRRGEEERRRGVSCGAARRAVGPPAARARGRGPPHRCRLAHDVAPNQPPLLPAGTSATPLLLPDHTGIHYNTPQQRCERDETEPPTQAPRRGHLSPRG